MHQPRRLLASNGADSEKTLTSQIRQLIFNTLESCQTSHRGPTMEIFNKVGRYRIMTDDFVIMYEQKLEYGPRLHVCGSEIVLPPLSVFRTAVDPGLWDQQPMLSWRYQ